MKDKAAPAGIDKAGSPAALSLWELRAEMISLLDYSKQSGDLYIASVSDIVKWKDVIGSFLVNYNVSCSEEVPNAPS